MSIPWVKGYDDPGSIDGILDSREIVFGVPSRNVAHTIGFVLYNIVEGIVRYGLERDKAAIIVSDGLSSDATVEVVKAFREKTGIPIILVPNILSPGKGGAMKTIIDLAARHDSVDKLVFLDSDLRSITPEWIALFVKGLEEHGFAAPFYRRHKYDATITNFLARPLTLAAYGVDLHQPIGGDFGLGRRLIDYLAETDLWFHNYWSMLFGVDTFITHSALYLRADLCEVDLKAKIHEAKDPALGLKNMFIEVSGSLFNTLLEYSDRWCKSKIHGIVHPPLIKEPPPPSIEPWEVRVDPENAYRIYREGLEKYKPLYARILGVEQYNKLLNKMDEGLCRDEWIEILYKTLKNYRVEYRIGEKIRILKSLYHLWQGRLFSYYNETRGLSTREAYRIIDEEAETMFKHRDLLVEAVCG